MKTQERVSLMYIVKNAKEAAVIDERLKATPLEVIMVDSENPLAHATIYASLHSNTIVFRPAGREFWGYRLGDKAPQWVDLGHIVAFPIGEHRYEINNLVINEEIIGLTR
ncbi:MAG: hypothetical protein AABX51_00340 [Nanoarchaeota archaeon]